MLELGGPREAIVTLDDERLFPVFEAASQLGAAVFVHPWEMLGQGRMDRYWLPWLVGMVFLGALAAAADGVTTGTMEKAMERRHPGA